MIDLSIVPITYCNLNCDFCYLGKMRKDTFLLSLNDVQTTLDTYDVRVLDIYGGEVSLLTDHYVENLIDLVHSYFKDDNEKIYVTSNALEFADSEWMKYVKNGTVYPSFSYDTCRPRADEIKRKISEFDKLGIKYSLICIDIVDLDYNFISQLENMQSISIKPFSQSIYMEKKLNVESHMREIYVKLSKIPELYDKLEKITAYRDNIPHYFLLPNGKLHDIQYEDGKEYFCPIETCSNKIDSNCLCCKYYRKCFNEHYSGYTVPKMTECLGRKATMEFLDGL